MSMHNTPLTPIERAGLELHHLPIGAPSQLSDSFRLGIRFAQNRDKESRDLAAIATPADSESKVHAFQMGTHQAAIAVRAMDDREAPAVNITGMGMGTSVHGADALHNLIAACQHALGVKREVPHTGAW